MTVKDILKILENFAPLEMQMSFDNSGFCIGDSSSEVTGIMLCTDVTPEVVSEAEDKNCNLIISHHPVIFGGIKTLCSDKDRMRYAVVSELIKKNIAQIAMHTNVDICEGGTNDTVAAMLGVKVTSGYGEALRTGALDKAVTLAEFAEKVANVLGDPVVRYVGEPGKTVRTVAVSTGAGGRESDLIYRLQDEGIDALVTAEVRHNVALEARYAGVAIVETTHFSSERCIVDIIGAVLDKYKINYNKSETEGNPYRRA